RLLPGDDQTGTGNGEVATASDQRKAKGRKRGTKNDSEGERSSTRDLHQFRLPRISPHAVVVLGGQQLFHREEVRQVQPRRRLESRAIDSFLDLAEGDLVVHVSHGIARFRGMQLLEKNLGRPGSASKTTEEHLTLEFRDGVKLYVPASKIDLVQ